MRATKPEEVEKVLRQGLAIKGKPVLMDFRVDQFEGVYPMVPAGQPINKMLLV